MYIYTIIIIIDIYNTYEASEQCFFVGGKDSVSTAHISVTGPVLASACIFTLCMHVPKKEVMPS